MAVKFYCDVCGNQLSATYHGRLFRKLGNVRVEVMVGTLTGCNDALVCRSCILDVVTKGAEAAPMLSCGGDDE